MKLGPLQEYWVSQLEKYPEKQLKEKLFEGSSSKNYKSCCLGESMLCINRFNKQKVWDDEIIKLENEGEGGLKKSVIEKYGFYNEIGQFKNNKFKYLKNKNSLAELNDGGFTWPQIAAIIRKNPGNVFSKSV